MSNKLVTLKNLEAYTEELKNNLSYKEIIYNPRKNEHIGFLSAGLEELLNKKDTDCCVSNCYKIMPMKLRDFKALFANGINNIVDFQSQLSYNIILNFIGYAYLDTRVPMEEAGGEAPSFYMRNYYMEAIPVKVKWYVENGEVLVNNITVYANDWNTVIEDDSTIITGELILSVYNVSSEVA